MKILFLSNNFPPERNAAASRVFERGRIWAESGHELTVITCAPHFPEGKVFNGYRNTWSEDTLDGVRVVRVPVYITANERILKRILSFTSYMVMAFLAGLFQRKADVVVATTPQFFTAIAGWALSRLRREPFILEVSDLWPASISAVGAIRRRRLLRLLEAIELFLYRQASGIVVLSQAFKDDMIRRGIDGRKITVVMNGVDLARYSPQPRSASLAREVGLHEGKITVGYIGTLGLAHGLENVLETASLLANQAVQFLFVGTGAARTKLESIASATHLRNVVFVPAQPKDRVTEFWSLCDIALVHLSDAPLFSTVIPSKIFEAMGMGLPIVLVAPPGEATRIVQSEEVGVCVPPAQPLALAQSLLALHRDPGQRDALSRCSLAAAPMYTRQRQADEMLKTLLWVTKPGTASPQVGPQYASGQPSEGGQV